MADSSQLKQLLERGEFINAPGVFDPLSARLASQYDFRALYMSGYAVSATLLGAPDAGLISYREMVNRLESICEVTDLPVIADGDTGFGGLANVRQAVKGYERAGAAAIQLEDQQFPKRCGHTRDRIVVESPEMIQKIQVSVESRTNDEFLIIARTDARTSLGLDEAIKRACAYAEAGADILFVESPESGEELETIGRELRDSYLMANMVCGGRTPMMTSEQLLDMGFQIVIHPIYGLGAAVTAMKHAYQFLCEENNQLSDNDQVADIDELNELLGFADIWALDDRYAHDN